MILISTAWRRGDYTNNYPCQRVKDLYWFIRILYADVIQLLLKHIKYYAVIVLNENGNNIILIFKAFYPKSQSFVEGDFNNRL